MSDVIDPAVFTRLEALCGAFGITPLMTFAHADGTAWGAGLATAGTYCTVTAPLASHVDLVINERPFHTPNAAIEHARSLQAAYTPAPQG